MSTKLPSSPTPKNFADALVKEVIAPAVRRMGGESGIVTPKKAAEAELSPGQELARDNVRNFFEATDRKRISADNLIGAAYDYAKAQAAQAAGKDGRLSQADAAKLRADLQADFAFLRSGRLPPVATQPIDDNAPNLSELFPGGAPTELTKPQTVTAFTARFGASAVSYEQARANVLSHIATNHETWGSLYGHVYLETVDGAGLPESEVPGTFKEAIANATFTFKPEGYNPSSPDGASTYTFLLKLATLSKAFAWYMVDRQSGDVSVQIDD